MFSLFQFQTNRKNNISPLKPDPAHGLSVSKVRFVFPLLALAREGEHQRDTERYNPGPPRCCGMSVPLTGATQMSN